MDTEDMCGKVGNLRLLKAKNADLEALPTECTMSGCFGHQIYALGQSGSGSMASGVTTGLNHLLSAVLLGCENDAGMLVRCRCRCRCC